MFLFLWILFLADSRKFYALIFADGFYVFIFLRILFVADVYFISRWCLRILFLADSRKFYPLIFADGFHFSRIFFISRWFSQILCADFRGWFSFPADFFMFLFCWCLFYFSRIFFYVFFLRISFLADYRKFYPLIFADGFHFSRIFFMFSIYTSTK